jgi:hypothetical protein
MKLNTLVKEFLQEEIEIRNDWYDTTKYLETYLVGDDTKQKTTNLDALSDDAYADIVMDDAGYTGEYEKPLLKWIKTAVKRNKYPEYLSEIPKKLQRKIIEELFELLGDAFAEKDAQRLELSEADEEMSTPEKRIAAQKEYYKKLPLFKLKDILVGLKRKSKIYKDMGQKVPKPLISQQRTLYYIIKKKEEEQMEKKTTESFKFSEQLAVKRSLRPVMEDIVVKKDTANNRIVIVSDLPDKKSQAKETIKLAKTFRSLGLDFDRNITRWVGPYSVLVELNKFLKTYNKVRDIIDKVEGLEELVADSDIEQSAKDLIIKNLDQYLDDLANATDQQTMDAAIRNYFKFWSNFHNYSIANTLLIYMQKPNATKVAGYHKWREKGRQVVKGAKSIRIWVPKLTRDKNGDVDADLEKTNFSKVDKETEKEGKKKLTGFVLGTVFDISDTKPSKEGVGDIPETPKWFSDNDKSEVAEKLSEKLKEFAKTLGINLTQSDSESGEKGYSAGGHINMSSDVAGSAYASTLVHELAHELMHWRKSSPLYVGSRREEMESDKYLTRDIMELQAESVSYIVMKYYNLPCKHHPTYLALWKANSKAIKDNLDAITKCGRYIINAVDNLSDDEETITENMNTKTKLAGLARGFVQDKNLGENSKKKRKYI